MDHLTYVVIYPNDDQTISIIYLNESNLTKEEVALKDVPEGKPFKILKYEQLPEDTTFRGAWTFDFIDNDGHGMNNDEWYEQFQGKLNDNSRLG